MEDVRFGSMIRTARIRKGWRQLDLAEKSDVSRATISRIEGGNIGSLPLDLTRAVCKALEISIDLVPRWRGGELDRMLSVRHSQLHESVARMLTSDFPDWVLAPEVSFARFGERGVIDLLLWHPARRALLVIEFKTDLVDVNELLGTMDRKRRLAWEVAKQRGWVPRDRFGVDRGRRLANERPAGRGSSDDVAGRLSGWWPRGAGVAGGPGRLHRRALDVVDVGGGRR